MGRRLKNELNRFQESKHVRNGIFVLWSFFMIPLFFQRIEARIDWSWQYALNCFTGSDIKFGRDVFFTYGPLGFLGYCENVGNNLVYGCIFWAVIWVVFIYLLRQINKLAITNLTLMISMLLVAFAHVSAEYYIGYLVLICIGLLWTGAKGIIPYLLVILLGISFLFKFSLFIFGLSAITVYLFSLFVIKCEDRFFYFKRMMLIFIAIPFMYLFYNPNIGELINYAIVGFKVAGGFSSAMALSFPRYEIASAIWVCLFFLYYAVLLIVSIYRKNYETFWYLALFGGPIFLVYKHGFVRADPYHLDQMLRSFLMIFSAIILFMKWEGIKQENKDRYRHIGYACGILIAGGAITATFLFNLLEGENLPLKHYSIISFAENMINIPIKEIGDISSGFKEEIKGHTVTFFPTMCVVESDEYTYVPLPLLENYSAYDSELDSINSKIFEGSNAVDYIVCSYEERIDGRLPIFETPETWKKIFSNYQLVNYDINKNQILLKKCDVNENIYQLNSEMIANVENEILIPDYINGISIDIELNYLGKIINLLWKIPVMTAKIEYENGTSIEGRVVVQNLSNTIDVNVIPKDSKEFAEYMVNFDKSERIRRVRLDGDGLQYCRETIKIMFWE